MKYLLLTAVFLLAVFARLFDLSSVPNGLHWDEQDTGYQAYSLYKTGKDYFGNPLPLLPHSLADYRTPVFIYSAVPSVAAFGLTPWSVRLPSVVWSTLSLILFYVLARQLVPGSKIGWVALTLMAFSPWHFSYSRQSVESIAMLATLLLGVNAFLFSLKRPRWTWVAILGFALAIASYSTAKFFVPAFGVVLVFMFRRVIFSRPWKMYVIPLIVGACIAGPIVWDGMVGPSGTRFHDVSIFTDPQLAKDVDYDRFLSVVSASPPGTVGLSPRVVDKISFNKVQRAGWEFVTNYLRIFSTEYLFTKGDSEPRHSPGRNTIGQFHAPEVILLVAGLYSIASSKIRKKTGLMILAWILIGAIPSSLTRGGGPHAARTFLLLPAFLLVMYVGVDFLYRKSKAVCAVYLPLYLLSLVFVGTYFFSTYRFESARPFNWGFDKAVQYAVDHHQEFPRVFIDMKEDSGLMAYLFTTRFDPARFQALQPLPVVTVAAGINATRFENIYVLQPGIRNWTDIISQPDMRTGTLIITDATQPLLDVYKPKQDTILYPDSSAAFFVIIDR